MLLEVQVLHSRPSCYNGFDLMIISNMWSPRFWFSAGHGW